MVTVQRIFFPASVSFNLYEVETPEASCEPVSVSKRYEKLLEAESQVPGLQVTDSPDFIPPLIDGDVSGAGGIGTFA